MLRVVTYNVHKCRGLDRRVRPARVARVLADADADIVALQEVWSVEGAPDESNQARFIARELSMEAHLGINRSFDGGAYGNVILTRLPARAHRNYDITHRGREPRGCLRVDIELPDETTEDETNTEPRGTSDPALLHVFNVHLGTSFMERRHQARRLLDADILNDPELTGARLVLGDFNEWTRGLASDSLARHLVAAEPRAHLRRSRTYPGLFPLLHLDHIYHDPRLVLVNMELHRTPRALVASDHLPLVADFRLVGS